MQGKISFALGGTRVPGQEVLTPAPLAHGSADPGLPSAAVPPLQIKSWEVKSMKSKKKRTSYSFALQL